MFIRKTALSITLLLFMVIQACEKPTMFTELTPDKTGIKFSNTITEDGHNNIMTYEYTYNGAGVAVGDVNNDGLTDIYFVGNQVPNKLFLNLGDWKFEEITLQAGVQGRSDWKTGVTMVDVNGDGWLDIYVSYSGNAPSEGYNKGIVKEYSARSNQLFINDGGQKGRIPTFTERAQEYGIDARGTFTSQAYFFDYDLDGDLDMFLLNHANMFYSAFFNVQKLRSLRHPYFGNKLYRNDNQRFTEVTETTGIHGSGLNFGLSASISDINKDGWPDIYVTNDYEEQDFCYLNNGDGTFMEISHIAMGHLSKYGMGSDIADVNNDGLPDIYVADMLPEDNYRQKILKGPDEYNKFSKAVDSGYHHQYMRNTFQLNRGLAKDSIPRFSEIAQFSGISNTDWSWATLFADFDNDGMKDLFITNGYLRDVTNLDFVNFTTSKEISQANSKNQEVDLLPLISKMPATKISNYSFRNTNGIQFENRTSNWGLDKPSVSTGAAYADLDNDGDLDLIVSNLNAPATIFQNNQQDFYKNNYIKIKLEGEGNNTFGLGAKIITTLEDQKQLYHEAYYTRGYLSAVEPLLTIGIGEEKILKKVEVVWPDGGVSVHHNIEANQELIIKQVDAVDRSRSLIEIEPPLFEDVTTVSGLDFVHRENDYVDFLHQGLVPYQLSRLGGRLAVGDVNGDGNDDVFFGGAAGQSGQLYLGRDDGTLVKGPREQPWTAPEDVAREDIDILFFDADSDNDLDMYVVSGGNEKPSGSSFYKDRLYLNDGTGNFVKTLNSLPHTSFSGGVVVSADYDKDGDIDLFVGGRHKAKNYPFASQSILLRNDTQDGIVKFTNTEEKALQKLGMVTDAVWTDSDKDSWPELFIVGEWMPLTLLKNNRGILTNKTKELDLDTTQGWWSSIDAEDYDGDGDVDFLLGNAGLNTQLFASKAEPMVYYVQDFNKDGNFDPVLSYYIDGESYPLPSRDEMLGQVASLRKKYTSYDKYAKATMEDLLKAGNVTTTSILEINELRSLYLNNLGDGNFNLSPLPGMSQISMINAFAFDDFTGNGVSDIVAVGNFSPYRVNFGKSDALMGVLLNVMENEVTVDNQFSNLWLSGDIRDVSIMEFNSGAKRIILSRNDDKASLYKYN
ncbi:type IV secretion protein Rhs [Salegentibacter salinarum]|uniref:Type IV secretion protein Rhs n=1 Tax=Salegentibacter salinarum TaxID=447422 RepID=A0A2N0TR72_9FLAO|nr:type IV secretion protein Rhs [Salegentibacter salinarum]